ncbi:hypothetical protein Bca52824_060640 [Brassica carinata]|uniref:Uncharacterized protein n=1 Tax=Brassica carinata TaxID=52824 RepID=A0A8X7UFT3_BRACI|nr:hypothetical protein Bca52824_060640 [Brassica carinata]
MAFRTGLSLLHLLVALALLSSLVIVKGESPYKFYTWTVTYGIIYPLGVPQQVILINGQFPGPKLDVVTNDNIILNLINKLDQPFLLTWNGIKQRKNSWQDGVLGTNCPIPPNSNFTYKFQTKDQIGTYNYFPSTAFHKAAVEDFTLLIGDWFKTNHKTLQQRLDSGGVLPFPDGMLINGQTQTTFTGDQGEFIKPLSCPKNCFLWLTSCVLKCFRKTYMFRISNVGSSSTFNFRIQGHTMKVVEVEGSHVMQTDYDSLDVHVGQSLSLLVTLNQSPKDYYIVASTRFVRSNLSVTALLRYSNSGVPASGDMPPLPPGELVWSMRQARTFRWNLTANAARPNPQGSFHYGKINTTKSFVFSNSAPLINGKQRYAVNGVSYVNSDTPLKLADHFNIPGVFSTSAIQSVPSNSPATVATSVVKASLHDFLEILFQNNEKAVQSWHLDGYDFWVVGFGSGQWTPAKRQLYNLVDALTRHTTQVYPNSWTAILVSLDNQGMWNMRSAIWERQYLGQQFYLKVWDPVQSLANEYNPPDNLLLCGKAIGRHL